MWGAILIAASLNNVGSAEQCSATVFDLRPLERVAVQVSVIFPLEDAAPLTWRVYSTLDDFPGGERWDTEPLLQGSIAPADPGMATIRVDGVSRFRVCVAGSDAAVAPLVDFEYRRGPAR